VALWRSASRLSSEAGLWLPMGNREDEIAGTQLGYDDLCDLVGDQR
jgi:hypothetical protein